MTLTRNHTRHPNGAGAGYHAPPAGAAARHDWLCALSDAGRFLFHGSQRGSLAMLSTTRESGDISEFGRREQVFATPDVFWAMWFAILDRSQIGTNFNGCFIDEAARCSHYDFGIDAESYARNPAPLREGWIYVLSPDSFTTRNRETSRDGLFLAEWGSADPVTPLAHFAVTPADFPYVSAIQARELTSD